MDSSTPLTALSVSGCIHYRSYMYITLINMPQTPHSMRELIMGITYCISVLFTAIGMGISVPSAKKLSIWATGVISCGF